MSRNAADAPSSAPTIPTDERRPRSPRRPSSTSPPRRPIPTDPQPYQRASPPSNIASHHPSSSSRVATPPAATAASDPESSSRKRKRAAVGRSSPSGSSSQGDMADTEMEGGASKPSASESAPEGPPPKKKRTRTLTTPHQAAVLHALLAQVRPPIVLATRLRDGALTPVLLVAVPYHPDARRGRTLHRTECSQSAGTSSAAAAVHVRVLNLSLARRALPDLVSGECTLSPVFAYLLADADRLDRISVRRHVGPADRRQPPPPRSRVHPSSGLSRMRRRARQAT